MNKPGEINKLSKIIKPNLAIITNIAAAHIENFKNIKGIAKEKSEIINDLIIAAHNDAKEKLKKRTSEELLKATGVANFPIDFKLPF